MSKRSEALYLGDMVDQARRAVAKMEGVTRAVFDADDDLQTLLTHLVQIIGEAASNISDATRAAHPEIEWPRIIGMRHRLVHNYYDVDENVLWTVLTERLPDLIAALEKFTPPEPPSA